LERFYGFHENVTEATNQGGDKFGTQESGSVVPDFDDLESAYPMVVSEIARRILVCEEILDNLVNNHTKPDAWMGSDLVTLQIRKICEMLLLGSTFVHLRESGSSFDLSKWHPKDTFTELNKFNEYPLQVPIELNFRDHPSGSKQIMPACKPLPYKILSTIYGRCNDLLHVPSVSKVLRGKVQPFDIGQFQNWIAGFKRIIAAHVLMMPTRKKFLLCKWTGKVDQSPLVYLMEGDKSSTFDFNDLPEFEFLTA
jgi:hypothetical protein